MSSTIRSVSSNWTNFSYYIPQHVSLEILACRSILVTMAARTDLYTQIRMQNSKYRITILYMLQFVQRWLDMIEKKKEVRNKWKEDYRKVVMSKQ